MQENLFKHVNVREDHIFIPNGENLNSEEVCGNMTRSGEDKAEIVQKAFFGPITPQVPASVLQLHNDVTLVADEAALSKLSE